MSDYEFTPSFGNRPSKLVGRSHEIASILDGLDSRPGSKERAVVLLGQRGYGKTVLLWEIADKARERGFVIATPTSVREGLLERIVEKIQEDGQSRFSAAQTHPSGVGVGVLGFSASLQFSHDDQKKSAEHRLTTLCRRLTKRKLGALILVDELQANSAEVRRLVGTYQELVGEGLDVAMVLAGLPSCVSGTLNDKVLTFLNRARKYELGPLALGDIDAFYLKAFRADGIKIERDQRRRAAELTEGSPYLMQLVGYYLSSYAVDGVVDQDSYEDALQSAKEEFVNDVCATTVAGLSGGDVAYLKAMGRLGGSCRTADVAAAMGVTPDYGQQYRRRLLDAGIIKAPRKGLVGFDVPFLADYIARI